jgi:hypothetical protein
LNTLLLRAKSRELECILPDIAAKNSESTKAVLKQVWTQYKAYESLRNAVKAGKFGLAQFILKTWDLPEKRQLDDLYRAAECSEVNEGKEELLRELLKHTMSCGVRMSDAGNYDYARHEDDYTRYGDFSDHYGFVGTWDSQDTDIYNPAIW